MSIFSEMISSRSLVVPGRPAPSSRWRPARPEAREQPQQPQQAQDEGARAAPRPGEAPAQPPR